MKTPRHFIVYDTDEPTSYLNIQVIADWQERNGIALIICHTLESLKRILQDFPHDIVLVSLANRERAARGTLFLRNHGVSFIIIPEKLFLVDYFDVETLDLVPPELVFGRKLVGSRFHRTHHVVNWGRTVDTLSSR
ncbi:MAG: hypothetical protein EXS51_01030 [Candidatus Taylorbacteria bacterium]|nr:hypothetical protein [Candidatus Taylorbacteria bacterium]